MYRILVADDEEYIRKGIIAIIGKVGGEFEIDEAMDGEETLRIIREKNPDIVLLDVRMPFMRGIDVLEECRNAGSASRFIIISGYPEFEYAQKALNFGAEGYVLKPVDPEKIQAMIVSLIGQINETKRLDSMGREREGLRREAELLKVESTVNQLVHAPVKHVDKKLTVMDGLPPLKDLGLFRLLLLHIDSCNFNIWDKEYKGIETIKSELKNILAGITGDNRILIFNNQKNIQELFVLVTGDDPARLQARTDLFLAGLADRVREGLKLSLTIAAGEEADVIDRHQYERLRNILDLRFSGGIGRIYRPGDLAAGRDKAISEEYRKLLVQAIGKSDYDTIKSTLKDIFGSGRSSAAEPFNARRAYGEVIGTLSSLCASRGIDIMKTPIEGDFTGEILDYLDNKTEVVNYLHTTIVNALGIEPAEAVKCSSIIDMVIRYVEENYNRPLSVKEIAVQFAMNPNYFSSLFKKVTGYNFIEFTNNRKIEAACRMLALPSASVGGIAESLGFQDIQYFYKLFKKTTGTTPLEFRKSILAGSL